MSRGGRRVLLIGSYRFNNENAGGYIEKWRCTGRNRGCKSRVWTINDNIIKYMSLHSHAWSHTLFRSRMYRESTNIYIGGQKFCRHSRSLVGNRIRWTCAKKHKHKCKVSAVTIDGVVVSTSGEMIHTTRGIHFLFQNYTYNRKQSSRNNLYRWYCSKYHSGCRATVLTNLNYQVTRLIGDHIHPPPNLHKLSDGKYILVKS
ncbi:unnamed protein product [Leptidea sinapis]|uniref:FLYWCH-type domain-containing protein n=1 Tax=Leptidea sinapis TaxID=189913 RepID=A0A5E4Q012_9NEOP|nr:unnamed protein product [Leptidea sinapis]